MLWRLISLDTRHPVSFKQPAEPASNPQGRRTCGAHARRAAPCEDAGIENKGRPRKNISATWRRDRQAAAEGTGITGMKTREGGGEGERKVEYISAESRWSILLPAGYSCKY